MNVLFITPETALHPILQSQGIPHMKGLRGMDIHYTLLSFEKRQCRQNLEDRMKTADLDNELAEYEIKWYKIPIRTLWFLPKWLEMNLLCLLYTTVLVFRKKIEIMHFRSYPVAFTGLILRLILKKSFIFDMRGLLIEERVVMGLWKKNSFYFKLAKMLERFCLLAADAVIVVSYPFRSYIKSIVKSASVTVIPNYVELHKFVLDRAKRNKIRRRLHIENRFVLLYSGSMQVWHSLRKMIDFFLICKTEIPRSFFLFLLYEHQFEVNQMMLKNKISPSDFKIIDLESHQIPMYLMAGDLAMAITEENIITRVCCPTKFAQYLACGLPVVTNKNIGDMPDIVQEFHVGSIVDPNDRNSIREVVEKYKHMSRRQWWNLKTNCRKVAAHEFSLKLALQRYYDVLLSIRQTDDSKSRPDSYVK